MIGTEGESGRKEEQRFCQREADIHLHLCKNLMSFAAHLIFTFMFLELINENSLTTLVLKQTTAQIEIDWKNDPFPYLGNNAPQAFNDEYSGT